MTNKVTITLWVELNAELGEDDPDEIARTIEWELEQRVSVFETVEVADWEEGSR